MREKYPQVGGESDEYVLLFALGAFLPFSSWRTMGVGIVRQFFVSAKLNGENTKTENRPYREILGPEKS